MNARSTAAVSTLEGPQISLSGDLVRAFFGVGAVPPTKSKNKPNKLFRIKKTVQKQTQNKPKQTHDKKVQIGWAQIVQALYNQ